MLHGKGTVSLGIFRFAPSFPPVALPPLKMTQGTLGGME